MSVPQGNLTAVIYLVRHGSTPFTKEARAQGQLDIPLSEQGLEDAHRAADQLAELIAGHPVVYTSDLARALETAKIIAARLGSAISVDAGLRERGLGASEGQLWADLPEDCDHDWEPEEAFRARVLQAVQRAQMLGGPDVVVVTHAGCLAVMREEMGLPVKRVEAGEVMTGLG